jgi:glycerophosphoryl diester phosphodiesterase
MTVSELRKLDAGFRFSPDQGRTFPFRGRGVRIPMLAHVLRAFPSIRLNIDLKPETSGVEAALAQLVRRERAAERICCGSELDQVAARVATRWRHLCSR